MRKFKHIPTGDIVSEVENKSGYYKNIHIPEGQLICGKYIIGCKDWEEIKEENPFESINGKQKAFQKPEYTILSLYKNDKTISTLRENGKYMNKVCPGKKGIISLEEVLPEWHIHSVRRESDGEVFTVGDKCTSTMFTYGQEFTIEELRETSTKDTVIINGEKCQTSLQCLVKAKPKEWEITAFSNKKGDLKKLNPTSGLYEWAYTAPSTLEQELATFKTIYSVKRLSDGVEFKIGDKIRLRDKPVRIIKGIVEEFGGLRLKTETGHIALPNAVKVEKLFTTEDGVDKFVNDDYYYISTDFNIINQRIWEMSGLHSSYKPAFHSLDKAKEYILMNKPCFSVKDACDLYNKQYSSSETSFTDKAIKLAKSKL